VDWRSHIPAEYRDKYVPDQDTIDKANKDNAEGKPAQDWEKFIPEDYRDYSKQANNNINQHTPSPDSWIGAKQNNKENKKPPAEPYPQTQLVNLPSSTSSSFLGWSLVIYALLLGTIMLGVITGMYFLKRFKKNYEYETVGELIDNDRLLFV